jgi:pimeloyl-ACP methyl ester carboxylesterase
MTLQYLQRTDKPKLAYHMTPANEKGKNLPTIVFLGGFRSDMEGTKATYLEEQITKGGQAYLRLDYSGHGQSGGEFLDGCIGDWAQDAMDVITDTTEGPLILVGSSMGGWISFLVANQMSDRVKGIVGLAAAPDFTRDFQKGFSQSMINDLNTKGYAEVPNDYSDEPYHITKKLMDDGEKQCFLDKGLGISIPITLIQGMLDADVHWSTAERIKDTLSKCETETIYLEDGDHRLSNPEQLSLIVSTTMKLTNKVVSDTN